MKDAEFVAGKHAADIEVEVVEGGASRSHSVRIALGHSRAQTVVVHDAARPLVTTRLFDLCLTKLFEHRCEGVVAAAAVTDTVKRVGESGRVVETLNRGEIWTAQTPQAFDASALKRAYDVFTDSEIEAATDDSWLVERAGGEVMVLEAPADNIKITTKDDLELARALLSIRGEPVSSNDDMLNS